MVIKRQSNPSHGDPHVDMCTYTQKGAQFASFHPSWEPMTKFYKGWENEEKQKKVESVSVKTESSPRVNPIQNLPPFHK